MSDSDRFKSSIRLPRFSERATSNNCASIPLALYCELSEELEATQQQLQAVHANNQKLSQQNQQLQQKIQSLQASAPPSASNAVGLSTHTNAWASATRQQPLNVNIPAAWTAQIEAQSQPKINGVVLAASIVLIVLTAFTCGFLIVRPLIQPQR